MSETEGVDCDPESEGVFAAQAAEIKELRNKIVALKKSVTKGDKKQKKAIQETVEQMEAELAQKQAALQAAREKSAVGEKKVEEDDEVSKLNAEMEKVKLIREKKQRKKEMKEAQAEAERQAAYLEVASRPDLNKIETNRFEDRLKSEGLRVKEVAADGHCMYNSILYQLPEDVAEDHWKLREIAAEYLLSHVDDYQYFVDLEECGNDFQVYCEKVKSTGQWGGHVELDALSKALNLRIHVYQAEGEPIVFGDEGNKTKILLSYHRHAYSLGEHYNALVLDER